MRGMKVIGRRTVFGDLLLGVLVDESIEKSHRIEIDQWIAVIIDGFTLITERNSGETSQECVRTSSRFWANSATVG